MSLSNPGVNVKTGETITAANLPILPLGITGIQPQNYKLPTTGNRPDLNGSITYPKTASAWFSPAVFSVPTGVGSDIYGNLLFNAIRGPGRQNWNLSLFKSFLISEARGSRFELRADAFNAWNHTQFHGDVNTGGMSLNAGSGTLARLHLPLIRENSNSEQSLCSKPLNASFSPLAAKRERALLWLLMRTERAPHRSCGMGTGRDPSPAVGLCA